MIQEIIRAEPKLFKYPRYYLDYLSGNLPAGLEVAELAGRAGADASGALGGRTPTPFWREILDYNSSLGASSASLNNLEALSDGSALPVVTGQQPGLFGGPLYTLYKIITVVSVARMLAQNGVRRLVPVLWNASDDSDFMEISSATFFGRELSGRKFFVDDGSHVRGTMVGAISADTLGASIQEMKSEFSEFSHFGFVHDNIRRALSVARDWGEFFSALFLSLFSASGLVVVDARHRAVSAYSREIVGRYLERAKQAEEAVLDCLELLEKSGYEKPVSRRSAEVCVFRRQGNARERISKERLPEFARLWRTEKEELLPNVLLAPLVRDDLMNPFATVLGPSEVSYYVAAKAMCRALDVVQRPIVPRLSLTIVPRALSKLFGREKDAVTEMVLDFDGNVRGYFEANIPRELSERFDLAVRDIRAGMEGLARLASSSGRGSEEVAASAGRKIEFEIKRFREEFVSAARKRMVSENGMVRNAREFLLPAGNLQERVYCSLAPLVHGGEPLMAGLNELATAHVSEYLDNRTCHYIAVAEMPA